MAPKRPRNGIWLQIIAATGLFLAAKSPGQTVPTDNTTAAAPPAGVENALYQMSTAAGVIFTGQVTAIRRIPGQSGSSGIVEVDFLVDSAVRGCVSGQTYTLREWAGLWVDSGGRYRIGQRLLMMLYPPGPSGISSPVGRMDGAIPIRGVESQIAQDNSTQAITKGAIVSAASVTPGSSASAAPSAPVNMVDLRWIGARTLRTPATFGTTVSGTTVSETSTGGSASVAAQSASVNTVLGMLVGWEQARAH